MPAVWRACVGGGVVPDDNGRNRMSRTTTPTANEPTFAYRLFLRAGHLIAEVAGRRLLIDTGSPVSIGPVDIEFAGQSWSLIRRFLGVSTADLQAHLGTPIDALIGMNALLDFDLRFDLPAGRLEMTRGRFAIDPAAAAIRFMGWIPLVGANLGAHRRARLLFDTGAQLSYLRRELLGDRAPHREAVDFYPRFGRFTTPVYRIMFAVGNHTCRGEFGVLPELLEAALLAEGADGILGVQLLADRPTILASSRQRLEIAAADAAVTGCMRPRPRHDTLH